MTSAEKAQWEQWVENQMKQILSWKTLSQPLNGQVYISPMKDPRDDKPTIIRPEQTTADVVAEMRIAIVVATSVGMWSRDADQYIPLDLKPGDGVQLVQAEGIYAGSCPVEDPICPVNLLAIHYRGLIGKFDVRQWLRVQVGLEQEVPSGMKFIRNGEG